MFHGTIKPEIVLQALGIVMGALLSAVQLRNAMPRSRARLKADLEILNLLAPDDPNRAAVKTRVDSVIRVLYTQTETGSPARFKVYNWSALAFGVALTIVFVTWSIFIFRDGFSWWGLMTSFFAFAGFGEILNGLEQKQKGRPVEPSQSERPV
jgi:hypothetical protein